MKDELGGKIMTEFVGLRSKMYSFEYEDFDENNNSKIVGKVTGKGIKRCTLKNMKHSEYKACLKNEIQQYISYKNLKSEKHIIYTKTVNKIGLSPSDDKRYILGNCGYTLPYGHYKLK